MYEEVCDAAQPSYNGGGATDSYGAAAPDEYGAAAAPLCRQEARQQCSTVPSQVLKSEFDVHANPLFLSG